MDGSFGPNANFDRLRTQSCLVNSGMKAVFPAPEEKLRSSAAYDINTPQ